MASNLKLMILKSLEEEPLSGYGLVKRINEKTGWKPSYGSIYPLLEGMLEEKLLECEETGRKKIYFLTSDGKIRIKEWEEKKHELFDSMMEDIKIMGMITGEDMTPMIAILKQMRDKDEDPFKELNPELLNLKNVMIELALKNKIKTNKSKIKANLRQMTEEMRKMI